MILNNLVADEPVSRILCGAPSCEGRRAAAIIPLGHGSRRDSSSLPEGCSRGWIAPSPRESALCIGRRKEVDCASVLGEPGRLSPPIWPCTTRGFPCLRCCHRSGGLLPHLFTLAKLSERFEDVPQVFLRDATVLLSAGGIFSVALSVDRSTGFSPCLFSPNAAAHDASTSKPHRRKSVLPSPWRYQARCPISSPALASLRRRCPDFPPAQPSCVDQASDHPAHPPFLLYVKVTSRELESARSECSYERQTS